MDRAKLGDYDCRIQAKMDKVKNNCAIPKALDY